MIKEFDRLLVDKKISPPPFLRPGLQYLTMMGSIAYNVSNDSSDVDVYGFCIPPQEIIYPERYGHIRGFGDAAPAFDQWQQHHIKSDTREYDFSVYSIIKYFQLCMDNNPNMIDSLFTKQNCVLFETPIAKLLRENRKLFLHKGSYHKFKGYAYSQLKKIKTKNPDADSKRRESFDKFGYDVKYAYHLIRLLDEAEQILSLQDLDLTRSAEVLKSIRAGNWSLDKIETYFANKEVGLDILYNTSTLQHSPPVDQIRAILLQCLEMHFGAIDKIVKPRDLKYEVAFHKIKEICDGYYGGD